MSVLIYGAYGYSGELITREACRQGLKPILAGRNAEKLKKLADELDLEFHSFDLNQNDILTNTLQNSQLVIHCAGPFSKTARQMIDACIKTKTHYLDITGEIDVFEYAHSPNVDNAATQAGIVICPGVGFDVIPTDCLAKTLKESMPDAEKLVLGFAGGSAVSPGTARTSVESVAQGLLIRQDGRIVRSKFKQRLIDFGHGEKTCMAISWGDVSTAYHSTGIPDIEVYLPASAKTLSAMKVLQKLRWLLKPGFIQHILKKYVDDHIEGPDSNKRSVNPSTVWAEASNSRGQRLQARVKTLNGYEVTKFGAVHVAKALLDQRFSGCGSMTPSLLLGKDLVSELPGSSPITVINH